MKRNVGQIKHGRQFGLVGLQAGQQAIERGVLSRALEGQKLTRVTVGASADGFACDFE